MTGADRILPTYLYWAIVTHRWITGASRAHIETHYPTYTGAPDTFESPNNTSWTYFKRVWLRGLRLRAKN